MQQNWNNLSRQWNYGKRIYLGMMFSYLTFLLIITSKTCDKEHYSVNLLENFKPNMESILLGQFELAKVIKMQESYYKENNAGLVYPSVVNLNFYIRKLAKDASCVVVT